MSKKSSNRSIQEMWSQFEVRTWEDISAPIIHWNKVESEVDFQEFITQAQNWPSRALAPYQMSFALEISEAPETYWKDPRTHTPRLSWRGQPCSTWRLDSSAQRISNKEFYELDVASCARSELLEAWQRTRDLLDSVEDELLMRSRVDFGKDIESDLEILSWAQHLSAKYQAPERESWATRLLDVSSDPLVALFFASQPCPEHRESPCDGRLIAFDDIINRQVTGSETKTQIRAEIGSIWRPSFQTPYQAAQKGEFLITGSLPERYDAILEILRNYDDQADRQEFVTVDGFRMRVIARDPEIIAQLAFRLQQMGTPGIRPAFAGAGLAFKKNGESDFPNNVAQSIRISGEHKEELLKYLDAVNINEKALFPES